MYSSSWSGSLKYESPSSARRGTVQSRSSDGTRTRSRARSVALPQRSQELLARAEVLEHVREDRDVEVSVGLVGEHVRLDVGDPRMGELRSGRREGPRARVDADDDRARALGDVSCDASDAAADVEHALPLAHAFDEEVVVPGEPVLGVLAASVVDCAAVHRDVRVAVDVEQLPHALALSGCARIVSSQSRKSGRQSPKGKRRRSGRSGRRRPTPPATRLAVQGRRLLTRPHPLRGSRRAGRAVSLSGTSPPPGRGGSPRRAAPPTGRTSIRARTRAG